MGEKNNRIVRAYRYILLIVLTILLLLLSDSWESLQSKPLRSSPDNVLIIKSKKKLHLRKGDKVLKSYKVSLGKNRGPKTCQGDERTPEGKYVLDYEIRDTRFYRSIHINYPNFNDKERARQARCNPGGDICLHGLRKPLGWIGPFHWIAPNWTLGCIAVRNKAMDQIAESIELPAPIEIRP